MKLDPESVIVCEGYHDRAFLSGWLQWHGCKGLENKPYRDGKKVKGKGQFAFRTPRGGWLRIVPTHGDTKLFEVAEIELEGRKTNPLSRLVIVRDDDSTLITPAGEGATAFPEPDAQYASLKSWAERLGARRVPATDDFELEGGKQATRLSFMVWRAPEPASTHLPAQQTLERLVCAAIAEVYGARCGTVEAWLASRQDPPPGEKPHKSHAASHMAGWFSERGYEGFFGAVWEDPSIRDALLARLAVIRAARVVDALLED